MQKKHPDAVTRYFDEVTIRLRDANFSPLPPTDDMLPVKWDNSQLCQVTPSGGINYRGSAMKDKSFEVYRNQVYKIAHDVAEYMSMMEVATHFKATGLDGDYRLLAEFNDVVLVGHPTQRGVQFITWERDFDKKGVCWGHYYGKEFEKAKLDFATRAGLVPQGLLLSSEQLAEVYRSIHETLENDYPLTRKREQILKDAASQIERAVPDLDTLVQSSNEAELLIQEQTDSLGMTQQF